MVTKAAACGKTALIAYGFDVGASQIIGELQ